MDGDEMDREKVIKALEYCELGSSDPCYEKECPYYQIHNCTDELKYDILALLKEQNDCENCAIAIEDRQPVVRCKDCKHGSLYCTEDVCGETLIECNRPDLGDVIEIHGWKWFCADGERR